MPHPASQKVLTLLRTAQVNSPGYEPVGQWIGPVASETRMREAQAFDTPEENAAPRPEIMIPVARCIPTQHFVYAPDIHDMLRRDAWRHGSILVYQVGGAYYIVNGHHRVACHAYMRMRLIKARIIRPLVKYFSMGV